MTVEFTATLREIEVEVTATVMWDSMDDSNYREGWYVDEVSAALDGVEIELTTVEMARLAEEAVAQVSGDDFA